KNELKACGTLLIAFLDKHQLKFNSHKDDKTLMEAIEKSLKIYEAKVKSSSSAGTTTQNIAFVSSSNTDSTTEPVSAAIVFLRSPNDSRRNCAAKPQRRNVPVKTSISNALLPILNPNEFNLWKMRIEQYFLMIDYSLWEVILNGDSPVPTRVVEGVLQPVASTTAKQKLARKNELKARAFLDKHQLKFNSHKDAKTLMEAIENSLKIYEAKVKSSSSACTTTQNIAFVSSSNTDSTTEPEVMTGVFKQRKILSTMLLWLSHLRALLLIMR
nr:DUF4219 domain-containing protein/UBN2 domain-containing protein [Tanacetum cinerariifolium]